MAASLSKHRRASPIPAIRRTRICRHQKTRSNGFYPRQLCSLRPDQRQAIHLLLGRPASLLGNPRARPIQKLIVPCFLGPGLLGTGSRTSQTPARRQPIFVASPHLPDDLLLRLSSSALSPPHRTRARNTDRVRPD